MKLLIGSSNYSGWSLRPWRVLRSQSAIRLRASSLPVSDVAASYVEAIYSLPAFQDWLSLALCEPWIVERDEIDVIQGRVAPGTLA